MEHKNGRQGEYEMTYETLLGIVRSQYPIAEEKDLATNGKQIVLENKALVNFWPSSGKTLVQGPAAVAEEVKRFIAEITSADGQTLQNREVFVVYGHDKEARNELELLLRRWNLVPLILDQLPSGGATVIEKLEANIRRASFGIVLVTPDDYGHRAEFPDEKMFRARQNVVLELGMLLSRLGRANVAILLKKVGQIERPSDIQGLLYIGFDDKICGSGADIQLAREIETRMKIRISATQL